MAKDTVCIGSSTTFEGVFTNDGTFNGPFEYRWLYSPTGNLTSQEDWVIIGSSQNLTLSNLTSSQTGFYRLAVAGAGVLTMKIVVLMTFSIDGQGAM